MGDNKPLTAMWQSLDGDPDDLGKLTQRGGDYLRSGFALTDFVSASVSSAYLAVARLIGERVACTPAVSIDRRLASLWFGTTLSPLGWKQPPKWDAVTGDYALEGGWLRIHANAPHHKATALAVLGAQDERLSVAEAVRGWDAGVLEDALVGHGACAAAMHTRAQWARHPQGLAVAREPLIHTVRRPTTAAAFWRPLPEKPLAGLRILDLTRVVAGPVATRFLAGYGANVLRIDPANWDEPNNVPEMTRGKRCAHLNLKSEAGREQFEKLLATADVLVHGYRSDALERAGLGEAWRRSVNDGLIDVALNAYGWTGPWSRRRGFDSLVQMSAGLAHAEMIFNQAPQPVQLPVQALDHATGYLMAAAVVRAVHRRLTHRETSVCRLSLARTAHELGLYAADDAADVEPAAVQAADFSDEVEQTTWGGARRLYPPGQIDGASMSWQTGARALGSDMPLWD